jgi:hypothetical protein
MRKVLTAGLVALACAAAAAPAPAAPQAKPYACPGTKELAVWFWPTGRGEFMGWIEGTSPFVELWMGKTRSVRPNRDQLGSATGGPDPFTGTSINGPLCSPAKPFGKLTSLTSARTSAPTSLDCSFPANPILRVDRPGGDRGRLLVVIPPNKLVVAVDLTASGGSLRYAKNYCAKRPPRVT